MKISPIAIQNIASISALGSNDAEIVQNYRNQKPLFVKQTKGLEEIWVSKLTEAIQKEIFQLRKENNKYRDLDASVLYAILVGRNCLNKTNWDTSIPIGLNLGSSRGATQQLEEHYQHFLTHQQAKTLASPSTTLGNISSWVAHDLQLNGPEFSHSITCSTGLHALLNGIAWLQAGICDRFMVGGTEAALTDFSIAQMQAMKIYSSELDAYPCKALQTNKTKNTMVLGEGAVMVALDKNCDDNKVKITGIGYATEALTHSTSISANGTCFVKSMQMALEGVSTDDVNIVVMHAPGTIKGDLAEINAVHTVFGNQTPALTNNKWLVGHTFGASGLLSLQMACLMLQEQEFFDVPYLNSNPKPKKIQKVLVNAVGFGGNAVSVLVEI